MSSSTVVLITGANSGIGYTTVRELLDSSQPYHIFLGARSFEKASEAISKLQKEVPNSTSQLTPVVVDIETDESIEKLYKEVEGKVDHIDVLINNAGMLHLSFHILYRRGETHADRQTPGVELDVIGPKRGMSTREIFSQTWNTNVAGSHILTTTFVPLLLKSSSPRLLFLTSGTASLELTHNPDFILNKAPPAGWPKPVQRELPSYKASKVGLNMLMRDWERILRNDGVKVWTVNPGFLVTGLGGDPSLTKAMGAGDAGVGGKLVRAVVEGKRDKDVGKTVQAQGILAW